MNSFHYNQRYTLKLNKNLSLARKCFCRVNHMQSAVIKLSFQPLTMNACLCMPKWFSVVFSSSVRLKKRHECTHQIQIVYIFSLFDYYRIFLLFCKGVNPQNWHCFTRFHLSNQINGNELLIQITESLQKFMPFKKSTSCLNSCEWKSFG